MKKTFLLFFVLIIFLSSFVSASNVGLIENSTWQSNLTPVRFSATAFGDIDDDNDLDLALIGCLTDGGNDCENGVIAKIYTNNGTSLVENSTWQSNLTAVGDGSLAWGDIDNDGDLDLVLSGCTNSTSTSNCNGDRITKVYINNGTSLTENPQWQQNLTALSDSSIVFGDIDNNGYIDLVMTGTSNLGEASKIYTNNGTSLVENLQWQNYLTNVSEGQIVLGDVDNDGDLDLALSGDTGGPSDFTSFYINNGTSFVESTQWNDNLTYMDRSSLLWGDYDNDGDLDLFLCGHTNADKCYLYKNNGSTLLLNQTQGGAGGCLPGIYRSSIAFGDYDNDGDLDFGGFGRETGRARVCENNETNNYYFQNDALAHANISDGWVQGSLAWVDLDLDLDLDLIIVALDGVTTIKSKIFINNNTVSNTPPNASTSGFSSSYVNNQLTLSWGNGSDVETPTAGLYYNLMVGNATANHTIVSGVYGGSSGGGGGAGGGASGYFGNMMQRKSITLNVELEANKTYNWYVQTIDTGLAKSNWSALQNFTTGLDVNKPNVTLKNPSPNASLHTINPFFTFNSTITDSNLSNVTLYADWTGSMIINETNSSGVNGTYTFTKNLTGNSDGLYSWYIYACDSDSNCKSSGTRTFYLDRAYPLINLISPASGTTSSSASVTFSYNVTDTDISNCSLIINGAIDQTDTSITEDTTQTFTKSMSNGDYNWYINCTDYVVYTNSSSIYSLTVSVSSGGGSSGGGSGGLPSFWSKTIDVSDEDFEQGCVEELSKKQRVKISINNETHYIGVVEITNTTATINISSNPVQIVLGVGDDAKVDVTNDGFYDVYVRLNDIIENKANLSMQGIYEEIPEGEGAVVTSGEITGDGEVDDEEEKETKKYWIIGLIVVLVVIIIVIKFLRGYIRHQRWKKYTLVG